jgi:hypothetical protein
MQALENPAALAACGSCLHVCPSRLRCWRMAVERLELSCPGYPQPTQHARRKHCDPRAYGDTSERLLRTGSRARSHSLSPGLDCYFDALVIACSAKEAITS